jgi:hypothetical protein
MEPAPALAGRQVHHDDPVRPPVSGVGDKGHALGAAPQVEAHIVEVAGRQGDVRREGDRLDDAITRQVHADQLGPAGLRWLE